MMFISIIYKDRYRKAFSFDTLHDKVINKNIYY